MLNHGHVALGADEPTEMTDCWKGKDGQSLPLAGEAFLVPLEAGEYTFAWIVGHDRRRRDMDGREVDELRVACSRWTGVQAPTQAELDRREVRRILDHRGKDFGPHVLRVDSPPPANFPCVGIIRNPEIDLPPYTLGDWGTLRHYARITWLRERDPRRLAALNREDPSEVAERRARARLVRARKRGTLAELAKMQLLPEWAGLTTKRRRSTAERWLRALVLDLRRLNRTASRPDKLRSIAATVEKINDWSGCDAIDTPEREALCTAIDDIGHAAGLRGHDLAGPWRDW